MSGFFKSIGKGILYLFVLPFFLIVLAAYAVFGLFVFIFLFFKSIILFFTGRSLNIELPEDIKAKEIIKSSMPQSGNPVVQQQSVRQEDVSSPIAPAIISPSNNPQGSNASPVHQNETVEEACFGEDEPTSETKEETINEPSTEPSPIETQTPEAPIPEVITKPVIDTPVDNSHVDTISTDTYTPKKSDFDDQDDDQDDGDDGDSGVDIKY